MNRTLRNGGHRAPLLLLLFSLVMPRNAIAQDRRDDAFYAPGPFNWQFLDRYPAAARLFNGFDYGHAVLYERLSTMTGPALDSALEREYRFLTIDLLVHPPRYGVAEEVVMPHYAKLVWRAKQMFEWAHLLHRQIYDVYADPGLAPLAKDALIERLTDRYLARKEYAFAAAPKAMALMDDQSYSQVFRHRAPRYNGLIWAYHWLQVGLYEPFALANRDGAGRRSPGAGIDSIVGDFWEMVHGGRPYPVTMPMTAMVAPTFAAAHPRAAAIFDNLHMMHDVISDILLSDRVASNEKRRVIYAALHEFQDGTRNLEMKGMPGM